MLFQIVVIVNGIKEVVEVVATTIFSAFSEAERQTGGQAIGRKHSEQGQFSPEFLMIAAVIAAMLIALWAVVVPALSGAVDATVVASETLEALGQ